MVQLEHEFLVTGREDESPQEMPEEVPVTPEEQERPGQHEIEITHIIDEINRGEVEDQGHAERVDQVIYKRDHPSHPLH